MISFPIFKQLDSKDCGPTCLRIIAKHYGKTISLKKLVQLCETNREGTSLLRLSQAAESIGFRTRGVKLSFNQIKSEVKLPCIAHWEQNHFVVIYKIRKNIVYVSDPAEGKLKYNKKEFIRHWIDNKTDLDSADGVILILETTPFFENLDEDKNAKTNFTYLIKYLKDYKKYLIQLVLGLIFGSILQLIFPFLTQSVVDVGIQNQNIDFIHLVLASQLMLFFGRKGIEIIRSWILLHLSVRINISLVTDFLIKLFKLPISYFDTRKTGDILQRIRDNSRVQNLLTSTSLDILFSFFNLLIFGVVLVYYNVEIFLVFLSGSIIYFLWVMIFLKRRKEIDYKRFSYFGKEQGKIIEFVNGMHEIKLNNAERLKRWDWEFLQARLYKLAIKSLILDQFQTTGSSIINEIKNILITILSAKLVIEGEITLAIPWH